MLSMLAAAPVKPFDTEVEINRQKAGEEQETCARLAEETSAEKEWQQSTSGTQI